MVDLFRGPRDDTHYLNRRTRHQYDLIIRVWPYLDNSVNLELLLHLELDFPASLCLAHQPDSSVVARADEDVSREVVEDRPDRESVN